MTLGDAAFTPLFAWPFGLGNGLSLCRLQFDKGLFPLAVSTIVYIRFPKTATEVIPKAIFATRTLFHHFLSGKALNVTRSRVPRSSKDNARWRLIGCIRSKLLTDVSSEKTVDWSEAALLERLLERESESGRRSVELARRRAGEVSLDIFVLVSDSGSESPVMMIDGRPSEWLDILPLRLTDGE